MTVDGKTAIVTGAGRGIGACVARFLAEVGASVACAARTLEEIECVSSAINAAGGKAIPIAADITENENIEDILEEARRAFGRLDIPVNNAGGGRADGQDHR